MTDATKKMPAATLSAPHLWIVALAGGLLLAFGAGARAEVPPELSGTWDPCKWKFVGAHPHKTTEDWALGKIKFKVAEEFIGKEEYYFDVEQSLTNKMQAMTLHIVRGAHGAIRQPGIDPNTVCNSATLDSLQYPEGDYTYMVGFAELAATEGETPTPHLVFFIPMRIGDGSHYHFVFGVLHLNAAGASATDPAALLTEKSGLPEKALRAWSTGDGVELRPSLVSILLYILNHNGIVHGPK